MTARVAFDDVSLVYAGSETPAVSHVSLEIAAGEFLVLVGPSGCGKSSCLRMLAGLEQASDGRIVIDGTDVTRVPAKDRDIAMVFQNYALYPHLSVAENMAFPLEVAKVPRSEIDDRIREVAGMLDLEAVLSRKPSALSGGQRQRVAIGRAIVREPRVFLMDEPLSNLDAGLRVQMRTQVSALQRRLGTTTVYVTHDQVEAMTMGDRVAVLRDGILQQVDTPRALYEQPANAFVAGFIGSPAMSLVEAVIVDGGVELAGHRIPLERSVLDRAAGRTVIVGIRPEALRIAEDGIPVTVDAVEELGADTYIHATARTAEGPVRLVSRTGPFTGIQRGQALHLAADRVLAFEPGGARPLIA